MTLVARNVKTIMFENGLDFNLSQGNISGNSAKMWIDLVKAKVLDADTYSDDDVGTIETIPTGKYGCRFFANVIRQREDGSVFEEEFPLRGFVKNTGITTELNLLTIELTSTNHDNAGEWSVSVDAIVGETFKCYVIQRFYEIFPNDRVQEILPDLDIIGTQLKSAFVIGLPIKPTFTSVSQKNKVKKYQEVMVNSINSIGGITNCLLFKLFAVDSSGLNPAHDTLSVNGDKLTHSNSAGENLINLNLIENLLLGNSESIYFHDNLEDSSNASSEVIQAKASIVIAREDIRLSDVAEYNFILINAQAAAPEYATAATDARNVAINSVDLATAEVAFANCVHKYITNQDILDARNALSDIKDETIVGLPHDLSVSKYNYYISKVIHRELINIISNMDSVDNAISSYLSTADDRLNETKTYIDDADAVFTNNIGSPVSEVNNAKSNSLVALTNVVAAFRLLIIGVSQSRNYRFIFPIAINNEDIRETATNITKQILNKDMNYSMFVNTRNEVGRSVTSDETLINTRITPSTPHINSINFVQDTENINILFSGDSGVEHLVQFMSGNSETAVLEKVITTVEQNDELLLVKINTNDLPNSFGKLFKVIMKSRYSSEAQERYSNNSNYKYFAYSYDPGFSISNFSVQTDSTLVHTSLTLNKGNDPNGQPWGNREGVWHYVFRFLDNVSTLRKEQINNTFETLVSTKVITSNFPRDLEKESVNHSWKAEIILNRKLQLNGYSDSFNSEVQSFKQSYEAQTINIDKIVNNSLSLLSTPQIISKFLGKRLFQVEIQNSEQIILNPMSYTLGLFNWDDENNNLYPLGPGQTDPEYPNKPMHEDKLGNYVEEVVDVSNEDLVLDSIITMNSSNGQGSNLMVDGQSYVLAVRTNVVHENLPAYSEWGFSTPFTNQDLIDDIVVPVLTIDNSNIVSNTNNNNVVFKVELSSMANQTIESLKIWRCNNKGEKVGTEPVRNVSNPIFTLNQADNKYYTYCEPVTLATGSEYFFRAFLSGNQGTGSFEKVFDITSNPPLRYSLFQNPEFKNVVVSTNNVKFNIVLNGASLTTLKDIGGVKNNILGMIIPKTTLGTTPAAESAIKFVEVVHTLGDSNIHTDDKEYTMTFTPQILNNNIFLFALTDTNKIVTHTEGSFFGNL